MAMSYAIVCGSHRTQSQSSKVGRYVENILKQRESTKEVSLIDLAANPLPLWDEGVWENHEKWKKVWAPISTQLQKSDAIIVISPEWSGMVPAGLKNFFLLCSSREIGHKPGYIISISSGQGGTYPVAELRTSSYKNTRLCYIPEHLILRDVENIFNESLGTAEDAYLRKRLEYGLSVLSQYALALAQVRNSGVLDYKEFPYGM